mmetsp:Transcript_129156/g.182103  ORF Transcript_129156/g.182103 Transcript_129156/m.182103 type:complete len:507 (+) Transcript_129156:118-1638(+)
MEITNFSDSNSMISFDSESFQRKGKWTPEEDELLFQYVPIYNEKNWHKIAKHVPGRSSIQCLHRWTKILKPGLVKGMWTAEEDETLIRWVEENGAKKWSQCACNIDGRSGKQCRDRWFNHLSPEVKKGDWSIEEDKLVFDLYQKYGCSWSKIAKFVPNRTENSIKNRFYSTLRKIANDRKKAMNPKKNKRVSTQVDSHLYALLEPKSFTVEESEKRFGVNAKCGEILNLRGEKYFILRDEVNNLNFDEEEMMMTMMNMTEEKMITTPKSAAESGLNELTFDDLQDSILNMCSKVSSSNGTTLSNEEEEVKNEEVANNNVTTSTLNNNLFNGILLCKQQSSLFFTKQVSQTKHEAASATFGGSINLFRAQPSFKFETNNNNNTTSEAVDSMFNFSKIESSMILANNNNTNNNNCDWLSSLLLNNKEECGLKSNNSMTTNNTNIDVKREDSFDVNNINSEDPFNIEAFNIYNAKKNGNANNNNNTINVNKSFNVDGEEDQLFKKIRIF